MRAVSYTMDTLYFTWIEKPVDIERNLQLPQFALRSYVQHDCSQNYTGGPYCRPYTSQRTQNVLSVLMAVVVLFVPTPKLFKTSGRLF